MSSCEGWTFQRARELESRLHSCRKHRIFRGNSYSLKSTYVRICVLYDVLRFVKKATLVRPSPCPSSSGGESPQRLYRANCAWCQNVDSRKVGGARIIQRARRGREWPMW